jgi:hypothetical protein
MFGLTIDTPDQDSAHKVSVIILRSIQKRLSGSRHGRWYPAPGNKFYDRYSREYSAPNYHIKFTGTFDRGEIIGSAYQASAPGEPPAVRTGRLRQSFFAVITKKSDLRYTVAVRSNVFYADDLEYGSEKISARPFIRPVMEELMPIIADMRMKSVLRIFSGD